MVLATPCGISSNHNSKSWDDHSSLRPDKLAGSYGCQFEYPGYGAGRNFQPSCRLNPSNHYRSELDNSKHFFDSHYKFHEWFPGPNYQNPLRLFGCVHKPFFRSQYIGKRSMVLLYLFFNRIGSQQYNVDRNRKIRWRWEWSPNHHREWTLRLPYERANSHSHRRSQLHGLRHWRRV